MIRFLLTMGVLLGAWGCDGEGSRADFDDPVQRGEFVYMRWCAGCHGPTGEGGGPRARVAQRPPPNLREGHWSKPHLEQVIRQGIDGTIMPAMPVPDDDLEALLTYLEHLSEP